MRRDLATFVVRQQERGAARDALGCHRGQAAAVYDKVNPGEMAKAEQPIRQSARDTMKPGRRRRRGLGPSPGLLPKRNPPEFRGVTMPFIMDANQSRTAINPDTNSRMFIKSGPQMEHKDAIFTSPSISLEFGIEIRRKFLDQPVATNDPRNPCVMLSAGDLNRALAAQGMHDFERNTRLIEYLIQMIAFINRNTPLANAPFLWSDYERLRPDRWLYHMPSDEELLKLTLTSK
jgi:hypothetical protein